MTYCTKKDLTDRFGIDELVEITDTNNVGDIDDVKLNQAIADAGAEIEGYVAGRYSLPLTIVPPVLKMYACDITRYKLYDDRVTEQVEKRYNDAMKYLMRLAEGKVTLGIAEATEAANGGSIKTSQSTSKTNWGTF